MGAVRPFGDLRESGLLWLINRTTFHPRGYALALHVDDDGVATGWTIDGDGTEPWTFTAAVDDSCFERVQELLSPVVIAVSDARLAAEVEELRASQQRLIDQSDAYGRQVAELREQLADVTQHLSGV